MVLVERWLLLGTAGAAGGGGDVGRDGRRGWGCGYGQGVAGCQALRKMSVVKASGGSGSE